MKIHKIGFRSRNWSGTVRLKWKLVQTAQNDVAHLSSMVLKCFEIPYFNEKLKNWKMRLGNMLTKTWKMKNEVRKDVDEKLKNEKWGSNIFWRKIEKSKNEVRTYFDENFKNRKMEVRRHFDENMKNRKFEARKNENYKKWKIYFSRQITDIRGEGLGNFLNDLRNFLESRVSFGGFSFVQLPKMPPSLEANPPLGLPGENWCCGVRKLMLSTWIRKNDGCLQPFRRFFGIRLDKCWCWIGCWGDKGGG